MALTDRLMDNLRVNLPGAIDNMIKMELWNTINDACREGHIWRETIDVPLTVDDNLYNPAPEGTEVVYAFGVSHASMDVSGIVFSNGTLVLPRSPSLAEVETPLFMDAALTPAMEVGADIEGLIPADMWSKHHQMWVEGVTGRMMGHPAKPYSNPSLAAYHLRAYKGLLARAAKEVRTGGRIGAQAWRFPRWAV